jgi:SAM-dependent methyltransferase
MTIDWNERYRQGDTPWDRGAPSPVVLRMVQRAALADGAHLLVPGCGRGYEVEALLQLGYRVTALDLAPLPLEALTARVGTVAGLTCVLGDFLTHAPTGPEFDGIVEHTCFCAIHPSQWPAYVEACTRLLRPGGVLLGAFLLFEGGGPPFGTSIEEIRALFEPAFDLVHLCPAEERFGASSPRAQAEAMFVRRAG